MSVPITDRKKFVLLRSARRKGVAPFLKQAWLTFGDSFLRRRHLIFEATAADVMRLPAPEVEGLRFREVRSWNEFRPDVQARLLRDREALTWGDPGWFDRGWRLWVGEFGADLATLCWWRAPETAKDFFIPIPEDAELMWQSTTMPEYRGKGLFTVQRRHLMRWRVGEGVQRFYVCCEDFNTTGRRNLPAQGFRHIGDTVYSKITGKRRWRPLKRSA